MGKPGARKRIAGSRYLLTGLAGGALAFAPPLGGLPVETIGPVVRRLRHLAPGVPVTATDDLAEQPQAGEIVGMGALRHRGRRRRGPHGGGRAFLFGR